MTVQVHRRCENCGKKLRAKEGSGGKAVVFCESGCLSGEFVLKRDELTPVTFGQFLSFYKPTFEPTFAI